MPPTAEPATPVSSPASPTRSAPPGSKRGFLAEFLRRPTQIGAVAPSSPYLAERMLEGLDIGKARVVVEYGPGTGAFTRAILSHISPQQTKFFAIEINLPLVEAFRKRFPRLTIKHGSVTDVERFCREEGVELPNPHQPAAAAGGVDVIISGLPWASFPEALQREALAAVVRVLRPGGKLVTFGYHVGLLLPAGQRFYRLLPEYFPTVTRSGPVWRNVPPAFVVRCVK